MFRNRMIRPVQIALAAAAGLLMSCASALAHPHVWVTMKSEVIYAADGSITGVRHAWTFDDMFSTFAVQGLESKVKGKFSREELQPLAKVNVESLKEFDYFNFGKADGKKVQFAEPVDFYLEQNDQLLTLHFTLPLKAPLKTRSVDFEVYDPAYFVDFAFAQKDAVVLKGAPPACKTALDKPPDLNNSQGKRLDQLMQPSENYGAMFANKISVRCP